MLSVRGRLQMCNKIYFHCGGPDLPGATSIPPQWK